MGLINLATGSEDTLVLDTQTLDELLEKDRLEKGHGWLYKYPQRSVIDRMTNTPFVFGTT